MDAARGAITPDRALAPDEGGRPSRAMVVVPTSRPRHPGPWRLRSRAIRAGGAAPFLWAMLAFLVVILVVVACQARR